MRALAVALVLAAAGCASPSATGGGAASGRIVSPWQDQSRPPWWSSPASADAPPALGAELGRLLAAASQHASSSGACYDGGGQKTDLTLLSVKALPPDDQGGRTVRVLYGVVKEEQGGNMACPSGCAPTPPSWGMAEIDVVLEPATGGFRLRPPAKWPLLEGMTPLDREHDGRCFGKTPPYSPHVVPAQ